MIFNAVLCVWNEEDIIESTVRHAFAQGCSHVFIVDNGSSDNTVPIALKNGAILADSFTSAYFDEIQKITHLNSVVKTYNESCDHDHVWWLYLDADEFPNIDLNISLFDFIKQLDSSVLALHGHMFEHTPTHAPFFVEGYHPCDFMPVCTKVHTTKMPLIRYDKNRPHIYSAGGAHTFDTSGEVINVVKDVLNIHHFNYRKPESTISRLKELITKNEDGTSRIDTMDRTAKLIQSSSSALSDYHKRYERARSLYRKDESSVLQTERIQYSLKNITRWYDPYNIEEKDDTLLSKAMRYLYLENYDLALCRFCDLLEASHDAKTKHLLTLRIAFCLSFTSKAEALALLSTLQRCGDEGIVFQAESMAKAIREDSLGYNEKSKTIDFTIHEYSMKFDKKFFVQPTGLQKQDLPNGQPDYRKIARH